MDSLFEEGDHLQVTPHDPELERTVTPTLSRNWTRRAADLRFDQRGERAAGKPDVGDPKAQDPSDTTRHHAELRLPVNRDRVLYCSPYAVATAMQFDAGLTSMPALFRLTQFLYEVLGEQLAAQAAAVQHAAHSRRASPLRP
jgi:hypothetical protein